MKSLGAVYCSVWRHWTHLHKHPCKCTQVHMHTHMVSLSPPHSPDYSELTFTVISFITRSFQTLLGREILVSWWDLPFFFFFKSVISFVSIFFSRFSCVLCQSLLLRKSKSENSTGSLCLPTMSLFCGLLFWVIPEHWIVANFHGNFIFPH